MKSKQTVVRPTLNGLKGPGRPTKRNKKTVAELLESISSGAPFGLACQAAGIHPDTFQSWRRDDPAFALQVEQVAARGALKRLKKIEQHGEENFSALAWMLERRYPQEFSRPEVQLNVNTQLNATTINATDFQTLVVSDLEYLGLKEQPAYTHQPGAEGAVREIEAVATELSGHLTREGSKGMVISQSAAEAHQRRLAAIRSKFAQLLEQTPGEH